MKINYFIFLLLFALSLGFTACNGNSSSSNDEELMGNWWEAYDFVSKSRSGAAGFQIGSKFYMGTGYDGDECLNDFWVFDLDKESWERLADFPGEARLYAVGFSINDKGYIGTGYKRTVDGVLNDFYEYDPANNTWTQIDSFPGDPRFDATAFTIGDKGYVGTGYYDSEFFMDFYAYDQTKGKWEDVADLTRDKRRGAQTFVIDGTAYLVSGYANSEYYDDLWAYNADDDKWTELRKISNYTDEKFDDDYSGIKRANGSTFVINGKGYLVCGANNSAKISRVWEYDPQTDLWEERTSFEKTARSHALSFSVGSVGYVVTGSSGDYLYDMNAFDPTKEYDEDD